MTPDIARRTAGISAPVAVLTVALGCGHSPTAPPPVENALPWPPAASYIQYNVSGTVTDEDGSPVANAELMLLYDGSFKKAMTSTDARGYYRIVFETVYSSYNGNAGVVAAIFYTGGGDYENYYVQAVPWGTADVVRDLRLRRVRTVNAGQSMVISIDADSSLAYDGEDAMRMDSVWEKFHIRVGDAGTLTVAPRPASGGFVPQIAVVCVYVVDNCRGDWVDAPPGSAARRVNANSLFEIRVAIPSRMAPQRYEVATSLER